MDLPNTLQLLVRNPELVAWRARGIVIRMTEGHIIQRVFVKHPYRWMPNYGDLVAFDWHTGTVAELQKSVQAELRQES